MEGMAWLRKLRASLKRNSAEEAAADWPEWYQSYHAIASAGTQAPLPLAERSIVVLDAETTGLDPKQDHLLSLGALKISGNNILTNAQFEAYLPAPEGYADSSTVAIHGLVPNSARYVYSNEEQLLADFLAYLGDAIIVGHHIAFDLEMINRALLKQGTGKLLNSVVDTAKVAERLQPVGYWTPKDQFTLDKLARRYRIPLSDRHTALGDAYITAVLWLKLMARMHDKLQREVTLADLR
ncbi:3'-5' exonuclease [Neolewinella lacunae]|uniref:3'-5' exonuclease n=1 Tax=Neolewinella lacunae TaxID=1517758 RepID=A0A923PLL0_9BACT|nr:3'-5' exonuclease [Neolewinella lacunae]MBC6993453.1 3'-5' exonuclease [Neolewinella lacunae]MDN3636271.1 3'-5' exonuclease [Neolewinella lacunae]